MSFDDVELVQYMMPNQRPDGGFELEFDGWEELPEDQRDALVEKLKIGQQKVNDAVQSRPIDADQLAARLCEVVDNQDAMPQAKPRQSRCYRTPTEDLDDRTEEKRNETNAYNSLVSDGCRPLYPISRLEEVFNGLEEFDDILQPWLTYPPDRCQAFRTQLHRWDMFRCWRQDNREMDEEKEFAAYVEEQKRQRAEGTKTRPTASQYLEQLRNLFQRKQRHYGLDDGEEEFAAYVEEKNQRQFRVDGPWPGMSEHEYVQMLETQFKDKQTKEGIDDGDGGFAAFVAETQRRAMERGRTWPGMTEDEYLQMLRKAFNQEKDRRYRQNFYWLREDHGRGGFPEYVAEAKRRLARHGFTKAFAFDKDAAKQDGRTTWIEYLNYEYSRLDKDTRALARLEPDHNKSWQKLLDSGALRDDEN
ncbi:uncharacterized protein MAM_06033 [Metarhizium album ARSEF 1941]|uniref:Uncharacterized protein n=1 Tax=Metarhizium album (strain ARSEF 1941) TaxID=1081103 RepID=A0A0B2WT89_METAS|nr:uncharacterized protein MAM_06033 [Metarhizium album ARSEF 1941]KHN96185.1 hypothetical protein MAM_06033 [Metarhizium album ARSEF 1941]